MTWLSLDWSFWYFGWLNEIAWQNQQKWDSKKPCGKPFMFKALKPRHQTISWLRHRATCSPSEKYRVSIMNFLCLLINQHKPRQPTLYANLLLISMSGRDTPLHDFETDSRTATDHFCRSTVQTSNIYDIIFENCNSYFWKRRAYETLSCVLKCVGTQCLSPLFVVYS